MDEKFLTLESVVGVNCAVRSYEFDKGLGKLLVPETLSAKVDEPCRQRILNAVHRLPKRNFSREILVVDDETLSHSDLEATIYGDYVCMNSNRGRIVLHARSLDDSLESGICHEWAHLLRLQLSVEDRFFNLACLLDGKSKSVSEDWAVLLGECIRSAEINHGLSLCREAPIRAAVIGRALNWALETVPRGSRSPEHERFCQLAASIESEILPECCKRLIETRREAGSQHKDAALKLLIVFATAEMLKSQGEIEHLDLADEPLSDSELEKLAVFRSLKALDLRNSRLTQEGLRFLSQLSALEKLSLAGTDVMSTGLKHLRGLQLLEDLDLSGTDVNDAAIGYLKELKSLRRVELTRTKVTLDAETIARALPGVEVVR
ncbi:MAG TPA: hypothetical protein V6D17_04950 [Candidatus Obscuribacterales bacterium]